MKKILYITILIFYALSSIALGSENIINTLKKGGKIVFIRHAYAPGNGDPKDLNLKDCSTQRNLNHIGIMQSKKIGQFFKKNKIKIDKVLSSEWCRCKDTARIAFKNFEIFNALNSFYSEKFSSNREKQIKNLKKYINNWQSDKNLVLVTHFVVISDLLNTGVSSGEIIVFDKNLKILGNIETI